IKIDSEILPELKNNKEISYQINSLVRVYNNLIEKLSDYDNSTEIISNQFVDPKDIVVLYKNGTPTTMNYREFLSGDYNVVANLIDNKINLVNSKSELNDLIVNTTNIQPAKVVVVYDLLNNIINPGIELTEEQKLLTTSDAIFDSSNTIVDNILRTKLVPRDEKNIYYKDDDGEYRKVRNKVNEIYTLNIDGNTYYFPSHDKLMIQLRKYLATQAERIVYE
ncbi:MAG: hypothetical protein K2I49_01215, partial [Ureaplasma sp.]|nr:hypothetical protein [Ureaplasma sp.]